MLIKTKTTAIIQLRIRHIGIGMNKNEYTQNLLQMKKCYYYKNFRTKNKKNISHKITLCTLRSSFGGESNDEI